MRDFATFDLFPKRDPNTGAWLKCHPIFFMCLKTNKCMCTVEGSLCRPQLVWALMFKFYIVYTRKSREMCKPYDTPIMLTKVNRIVISVIWIENWNITIPHDWIQCQDFNCKGHRKIICEFRDSIVKACLDASLVNFLKRRNCPLDQKSLVGVQK